eukprot:scaffold3134_cov414-Prasinococcus_capsulatus_cf.AAC.31
MARTRLQQPSPLGAMALGLAILVAAHCQSRGILGVRAAARGNDHGPAEQSLQADAPIISRSELVDWCGRQSEADKDRCRKAPKTCQRFNVTEGGGEDSSAYHVGSVGPDKPWMFPIGAWQLHNPTSAFCIRPGDRSDGPTDGSSLLSACTANGRTQLSTVPDQPSSKQGRHPLMKAGYQVLPELRPCRLMTPS